MPVPSIDHETAEPQTLDEIREWHRDVADALMVQRAAIQRAIAVASNVATRFIGMTEKDVDAWYDARRRELDRLTVLNLVASAEARIKVDYFRRVGQRLKDPLARAYREWHKTLTGKKQLRPDFDQGGILTVLKDSNLIDNNIVGRFRECLRPRHWFAHGRISIKPLEVDRLDPGEVYDRANALLLAMPD
ncbi:MAG TPA: hypothetical protein VHY91_27405 [Pirellulales bacterium]|jgi:hypothetical protein|nr:hypothetical protein [Pirellulales bacterium]